MYNVPLPCVYFASFSYLLPYSAYLSILNLRYFAYFSYSVYWTCLLEILCWLQLLCLLEILSLREILCFLSCSAYLIFLLEIVCILQLLWFTEFAYLRSAVQSLFSEEEEEVILSNFFFNYRCALFCILIIRLFQLFSWVLKRRRLNTKNRFCFEFLLNVTGMLEQVWYGCYNNEKNYDLPANK